MRSKVALGVVLALSVSAFATTTGLKQEIREGLVRRSYLGAERIRVRVEGGTVTLRGRVPRDLERAIAVFAVRSMPGVRVVKDELVVDPKLAPWKPTATELTRILVENARKLLRGDPELGCFTTLRVASSRRGLVVAGAVASRADAQRVLDLLHREPSVHVESRLIWRPDATRRTGTRPADAATARFAAEVTDAIAREPLLAGAVAVRAGVERSSLVLRGTARDLVVHDLVVEVARSRLLARQRRAEEIRARSGEFTRLLSGDPGSIEGDVPDSLESLVIVER